MSLDLTRFHESFFAESLERLDATETDLLHLEGGKGTPERLNAIFRGVHSIKGAAGSLGFTAIAEFTHHVEEVLDRMRQGRLDTSRDSLDILLACVDQTRALVLAARGSGEPDLERSQQLLSSLGRLGAPQAAAPAPGDRAPPAAGEQTWRIRFEPTADFFRTGNEPLRLLRVLDQLGRMTAIADVSRLPADGSFDPESCYLAWDIELATTAGFGEIEEVFSWVKEDCRLVIDPPVGPALPAAPEAPAAAERRAADRRQKERRASGRRDEDAEQSLALRTDRLHVSREKVDDLINLVGELVITKTMLKQSLASLDPAIAIGLETAFNQLERNTRDLQDSVMGIRMLPMSHAFGRFGRLVRDASQNFGKLVRLEVSGEGAELDKSVIEKLVDPLTHLVRNALDHGIETPAERRERGKPETAVLRLHAEHRGGQIEISVSDDGRGIDPERVESKAREAGLIGPGEAITLERATELIFEPGFSTAAVVNELSGRGVGLDVVKKNIRALAGSLKVDTLPGKGTTVLIRLPLTLAIIDGMSVTVGAETYIVPMAFIIECLQPDPAALKSIAGRGMLVEVRGRYLPLLELGALTGARAAAPFASGLLLVLESDGNQVALLVDSLLGQEQVVIKSLEANYRKTAHIAGATILGEGHVVLILDVGSLVRAARE
jgi:two-component system chemotaxis sensor kinase CheA